MPLGRIGILVSLFLLTALTIEQSAYGDLVLPQLESYVASSIDVVKEPISSAEMETQGSSFPSDANEMLPTSHRGQKGPSKSRAQKPVEKNSEKSIENLVSELGTNYDLVPEPSSIHFIAVALVYLAGRRRRRFA